MGFKWPQGGYVPEKYDGLSKSAAFAQIWNILQTRVDQRGDRLKMDFDYFQIQNWMLQTWREKKVDEKIGIICLVSMFPSCVKVLKLSKKVHFLQFCADFSKKPKSVKAA